MNRHLTNMVPQASEAAQDSSKRAQDGPMTAQDCLKKAQRGPKTAQEGSKRSLGRADEAKTNGFLKLFIDFWILMFPGFRQLKTGQEASKIAPI